MREKVISIVLVILLVVCMAIGIELTIDNVNHKTNNVREWVSPEGIHYWVYENKGIAPRYDASGELIIDEE